VTTYASLFTGGGGADIGAREAGMSLAWGVEFEPAIAEVANVNLGNHVKVANILDCDPFHFERVDILHASPPCPNFSIAKAGATETALDVALALKVAQFVTVLRPPIFTIENVPAYQRSKSWGIISQALWGAGYWLSVDIVNAVNYGVPQTRQRMIVRAVRGGYALPLPAPVAWHGWYDAIADLLPGLPSGQFAPWQLARLPEVLKTTLVSGEAVAGGECFWRTRSFILDSQVSGTAGAGRPPTSRLGGDPVFTITAGTGTRRSVRAFADGRVTAISPRCLARFQSFPDWYQLPESRILASKIIGNAVPPLLYRRIIEQMTGLL
jgi:DNA (cytosine-5)-methyltransferase 1